MIGIWRGTGEPAVFGLFHAASPVHALIAIWRGLTYALVLGLSGSLLGAMVAHCAGNCFSLGCAALGRGDLTSAAFAGLGCAGLVCL